MTLPGAVTLREVGPRDGLQSEGPIEPSRRAELAAALVGAGCVRIEAASFVSERAVPAMAGAAEVMRILADLPRRREVTLTALVPNVKGARAALEAGADELTATVAASPTYNERNVHRTIDESIAEIELIVQEAERHDVPVDAVVSCAFGSPYEGDLSTRELSLLVERLVDSGASTITLADTTGEATPRLVGAGLEELSARIPNLRPGLHLHDTRGTALVNAYAAMEHGATRFDTSIGGLGGSPFAVGPPGGSGNLATEDFVAFLDDLGVATGVDLAALLDVSGRVRRLVDHELPSKVSRAGPRLGGILGS